MQQLTVQLGSRAYPILIGAGLLGRADLLQPLVRARKVAVVTNTVVSPLYCPQLALALAGRELVEVVVPDGEPNKNLATLSRILDVLVANRLGRDDVVVALGGGVVGDMAGFAAATYQRGIDFIQVPTTLLAQVDSSVGGKTGVNHPGGKNLIGAFHQPLAVVADTSTLDTLPDRELRAGLAEVVKYGMICDAGFFDWIEAHAEALLGRDPAALAHAIRRSCEIKAAIVARDERETGDRALLNLGHTFGHAIESVTQYATWLHGEAVGAGLQMAATMSREAGLLEPAAALRVGALLRRLGLRTEARAEVTRAAAIDAMRIDKKARAGKIRFILMRGIGGAFVAAEYPERALTATLEEHFG